MKKLFATRHRWIIVILLLAAIGFPLAGYISEVRATALTVARDTPWREGSLVQFGVATNTRIFAGSMVAINATGYAIPAADAAGNIVVGSAVSTVDNRTNIDGAGDDGAKKITIRRGVFRWANGDTFTIADIGTVAYVEDDQTVQKASSASHDIICGVIVDVDSDGVWVDTYNIGAYGAGSLTTLATSSDASVGRDLSVTRNTAMGGTLGVIGNVAILTNKFTVTAASGNTSVGGTLAVTGKATLTAAPEVTALTANKVVFTDGSKVLTSDGTVGADQMEAMTSGVSSNSLVGTATFTNSVAGTRALWVWVSTTAGGAAVTNGATTADPGLILAGGGVNDYTTLVKTHTDGKAQLTYTAEENGDRFLNVALASGAIVSTPVMSLAE